MLESLDNFGEKLSYTYDDNGNIETIRKNGVLQETYHYDGLNQLVRADSAAQGKSFVYAYDAGGNILSVKEYAYTTGALGTAVKTVNYGYTDGTWKDLLTSYAGQTITYDGIGNPLSYRDGLSMTWRNGRELASLTKNGVTASYLYDESGLRTKKTVGGVVTNYHVINGVLYGEYHGQPSPAVHVRRGGDAVFLPVQREHVLLCVQRAGGCYRDHRRLWQHAGPVHLRRVGQTADHHRRRGQRRIRQRQPYRQCQPLPLQRVLLRQRIWVVLSPEPVL